MYKQFECVLEKVSGSKLRKGVWVRRLRVSIRKGWMACEGECVQTSRVSVVSGKGGSLDQSGREVGDVSRLLNITAYTKGWMSG